VPDSLGQPKEDKCKSVHKISKFVRSVFFSLSKVSFLRLIGSGQSTFSGYLKIHTFITDDVVRFVKSLIEYLLVLFLIDSHLLVLFSDIR
jgi:hypothetical protein